MGSALSLCCGDALFCGEALKIGLQLQQQLTVQAFGQQCGRRFRAQPAADQAPEQDKGRCPQGAVFEMQLSGKSGAPSLRFPGLQAVGSGFWSCATTHVEARELSECC